MNEVQTTAYDMLKEFIRICDELNLRWYMAHGSLLGAVKYQGFIPWDDDLDVAMPRKDYEIFCEKGQAMLPKHIFLQNYKTDREFFFNFTILRDTTTSRVFNVMSHLNVVRGISLDIFPLDGYPDDEKERKKVEKKMRRLRRVEFCGMNIQRNFKGKIRDFVLQCLGYHRRTDKTIAKIDRLITRYGEETEIWRDYGDRMYAEGMMPREVFGEGKTATFEGLEVKIPDDYDYYLTKKYGDWRSDPPKDEQKSHHIFV